MSVTEIDLATQSSEALWMRGGCTRNLAWSRVALAQGAFLVQLRAKNDAAFAQLAEAIDTPSHPAIQSTMSDDDVRLLVPEPGKIWFIYGSDETTRMLELIEALDSSVNDPTLPPADWCEDCGAPGACVRDAGREEAQNLCERCFVRWRDTMAEMRRIQEARAQEENASHDPNAYPPLELPASLTSERLWTISQTYEALQRENPDRYWLWIRAWVWLGQLVLIGAALGTVFAVLSLVGIGIAALTVSPWFALLLLKGKAIKFVLALAAGAFFLGWKAVRSVFSMVVTMRPKARELGGTPVSRDEAPALATWIDGIASDIGAPKVDEIRLMPGLNAFAAEVRSGFFGHRSVLGIGLDLMEVLDENELRAVVAHELGHLHHGDTRTLWVYRTVQDWLAAAWSYSSDEGNLLAGFARWYIPNFLVRARALCRQHEYRADTFSVTATSAQIAANALLKIHTMSLLEGLLVSRELPRSTVSYRSLGQVLVGALPNEPQLVAIGTERALREPPHWMDTHPPLSARLQSIGARPERFEPDFTSALSLLGDVDAWRARLAADQAVWFAFLGETMRVKRELAERYQTWLAAQPEEADGILVLRAQLLADLDRVDEAIELLDPVIAARNPEDLRYCKASILHNAFRYSEARAVYETLLAEGDAQYVRLLNEGAINTWTFAGDLDGAIALMEQIIAAVEAGRIGDSDDVVPLQNRLHSLQLEQLMMAA